MNRFSRKKRGRPLLKQLLLPAALFVLALVMFLYGVTSLGSTVSEESLRSVDRAVTRAAVQCYAIEGFYPPTLEYLTANYGLVIDGDKYSVDYRCFASNIMPDITVVPIG